MACALLHVPCNAPVPQFGGIMNFFRAFLIAALVLTAAVPASAFLDMFAKHEEVRAENGRVTIPVDRVSDGKAHYFRFQDSGSELRFFVLKSSDRVVRMTDGAVVS